MTNEQFFEIFDLVANLPDAIASMREVVLELAVRGMLTTRFQEDRKNREWEEFLLNSDDPVAPPFQVPPEWRWVTLADLGTTKARNDAPDDTEISFAPMSVIPSKYGCDPQFERRTWGTVKKAFTHFAEGDVVLAKITPCFENGKSAVMRGLANGIGAGRTELHVFRRTKNVVLPEFVLVYLKTRGFIARGESEMTGSAGQKRVPSSYFSSSPFPLPPPAEQKRIVAKVDELMALCDRLEAQQKEREARHAALARASLARFADAPTPSNLTFLFHGSYTIPPADLRKSILSLAVRGKLVPQTANDESADQLLETIARQRARLLRSNSLRKSKLCRQFTSEEAPHDIPKTWTWTMLGEIADVGTGSTPSRTESSFWIGGTVPWISSGSTSRSPITEGDELVTPGAVRSHRLRLYPPGTLLVALYGQGKTRGQVATLGIPATINQACAAISPLDGIPPMQDYLKLLLEKQYDEIRSLSAGGAQPNLNVQKIKEVFVPLPPLAEQRRIVAKVNQLMALVEELETQLAASRTTAVKFLDAIVGELTV